MSIKAANIVKEADMSHKIGELREGGWRGGRGGGEAMDQHSFYLDEARQWRQGRPEGGREAHLSRPS